MRYRPKELDAAALRLATYHCSGCIASAVFKNTLYLIQEGWTGFDLYALQTNKLPTMCEALPSFTTAALGVASHSPLATIVIGGESVDPKRFKIPQLFPTSSHAPFMTVAVPVHIRGNLNTMAKSSRKRWLSSAPAFAIAFVMEENELNTTDATESLHLSREAVATQEELIEAKLMECCVYTEAIQNLHETLGLQGGDDLDQSLTCYYLTLRKMFAAKKTFKTATMTFSTQRTWMRSALLRNMT